MIIEVDDKTGKAVTYRSLEEFRYEHKKEFDSIYKKLYTPEVEFELWNREHLEKQLPKNAGKIVRVISHTNYIVCKCENGETYSFDRIAEHPYFKIDIKPWQQEQFNK